MPVKQPGKSLGKLIKDLRVSKGWSQRYLSVISGVDRGLINQIENGRRNSASVVTLKKLAASLGVNLEYFTDSIEVETSPVPQRSLRSIINEMTDFYDSLKVKEIPVIGSVPAGQPFLVREQPLGYLVLSQEQLKHVSHAEKLFALKVSGSSLTGDEIYDGDYLLVDPLQKDIINGKIYVIRNRDGQCFVRHAHKADDCLRLVSSDGKTDELQCIDVEILGRAILVYRSQAL